MLYALDVGGRLQVLAAKVWDVFSQAVSVLKKFRGFYFAATRGAIHVLRLAEAGDFAVVRSIPHHTGMLINDFCFMDGVLVSVAENDDCLNLTSLDFLASL